MNLKIPAKRIFGDNFEPGKCSHKADVSDTHKDGISLLSLIVLF